LVDALRLSNLRFSINQRLNYEYHDH
jgi:hypothetical protein